MIFLVLVVLTAVQISASICGLIVSISYFGDVRTDQEALPALYPTPNRESAAALVFVLNSLTMARQRLVLAVIYFLLSILMTGTLVRGVATPLEVAIVGRVLITTLTIGQLHVVYVDRLKRRRIVQLLKQEAT